MSEKCSVPEIMNRQELDLMSLSWHVGVPSEFGDLSFKIEPFAFPPGNIVTGEEIKDTKYTYTTVSIDGCIYYIAGRDDVFDNTYTSLRGISIYFGREDGVVRLGIEIHLDDITNSNMDCIRVSRSLSRVDENRKLPDKIGRLILGQSDSILQFIANTNRKPVYEIVEKVPGYGGVPMTGEKWEEVFADYLHSKGYSRVSDDQFTKYFYP